MELADMLIMMGVEYGSSSAIELCDEIGIHLADTAIDASMTATKEIGVLSPDNYKDTEFFKHNCRYSKRTPISMKNSQLLTIAPTGTLSTMLGISGGIEPIFANSYTRRTESLHNKEVTYKVYTPIVHNYI